MSAIKVDSISARAGTGTVSLPSGNNLSVAGTSTLTGNTSVGGNLAVTGNLTVSGTNNIAGAGSVLETLTSLADGSTVTVGSGSYTFENVTAYQDIVLGSGNTTVTGSTISYTPPAGTTRVVYEFCFNVTPLSSYAYFHARLEIDGSEVTNSRRSYVPYSSNAPVFRFVIDCNASSDSTAFGRFTSWTSAKTLRLGGRGNNSGTQAARIHGATNWDGNSTDIFLSPPILTITAIK